MQPQTVCPGQPCERSQYRGYNTYKACSLALFCMTTLSGPQLVQYLQRINVPQRTAKQLTPCLSTLAHLQFAHLKAIPFENLSLHHPKALERKEGITCKLEEVFKKLVQKPRGGYCFEQNTLFAAVLRTLSFSVYTAAGRSFKLLLGSNIQAVTCFASCPSV